MKYLFLLALLLVLSCSKENPTIEAVAPVNSEYYADKEVEVLFENNKSNGINIVFLGEGYTRSELGKEFGSYRKDAMRHINALLNTFPFSEHTSHFNAYIVYAESEHTGPIPESQVDKSTAFEFKMQASGLNSLLELRSYDYFKVMEYTKLAIPNRNSDDLILLSVNNHIDGFAGIKNGLAIFGNVSESVMIHEVGHAFGGLGDEYEYVRNDYGTDTTLYPNLDATDDPEKIKWKRFFGLNGYEQVGIYEGGGYVATGIWRPENNSIMRTAAYNNNSIGFNAPGREAIVKRISEIAGLPYSFESFLTMDDPSVNQSSPGAKTSAKAFQCGTPLYIQK